MAATSADLSAERHDAPPGEADVLVVGGRVAGCAMAIHLRRAGLSVVVIERDATATDTLSTHVIQDLDLFDELGVLEPLLAHGAPPLLATRLDLDGVDLSCSHEHAPRLCLRRAAMDAVLVAGARAAGATVLDRTCVVALIRDGDRVAGATVQGEDGARYAVRSRLVVGADGRNSTVARLVGAGRYDVAPNERTAYWRYYTGVPMPAEFHLSRRGPDMVLAAPTDRGLTLVAAQPPLDDHRDWRQPEVLEAVAAEMVGPLRGVLHHAQGVGPVHAVRRMSGFFRDATGPGWVLVGDAGHFKDVVVGQGICDALRQSRALAPVVASQLGRQTSLDAALRTWWRRRDADARPMYWLAQDLGRVQTSVLDQEVLRVISGSPRHRRHLEQVLTHRRPPRHVVGATVTAPAVARAAARQGVSGMDVRAAVRDALRRERERRSAARRPAYGV